MAELNFDSEGIEPAKPFEVKPAGKYPCAVVASKIEPNKKMTGKYLKLDLQILEGPYKGQYFWDYLNLENPDETTRKIAYATLAALCQAVGKPKVKDSDELHGIPVLVKVKVRPATAEYEATNNVVGYEPIGGSPAVAAPVVASVPASVASAKVKANGNGAAKRAPWEK